MPYGSREETGGVFHLLPVVGGVFGGSMIEDADDVFDGTEG
jgi:hypothetical protein